MTDADTVILWAKANYRALGRMPSEAHGGVTFSLEPQCEEETRHLLHACCSLCRRPFRASCDVFMYRGDTPFCSEECRQEQIELDEARERETSYRRRRHQHHRGDAAKQAPSSAPRDLYALTEGSR